MPGETSVPEQTPSGPRSENLKENNKSVEVREESRSTRYPKRTVLANIDRLVALTHSLPLPTYILGDSKGLALDIETKGELLIPSYPPFL